LSKEIKTKLQVELFLRVQCGEGLESKKNDFAEEVAKMAAGA
jgi:translation elongation factor EF-Ts